MTGATAGLGADAAKRLMKQKGMRLIVGARGGAAVAGAETLPLDLARLEDVRAFATTVRERLGTGRIDALLLRLLTPLLAQGATVVLTTSGTHDPAAGTIVPAPRTAKAEYLAHPDRNPDKDKNALAAGGRAYSSSKLCNILTARGFAETAE